MATKRRPIHNPNSRLNFRPTNDMKTEVKGTKPTTDPTSIKEIITLMVIHLCKKSLFFDTNLKIAIYLGALFLVSLIADVSTIPKIYLSRSDNILNQYFVKYAWGWNLMLVMPYVIVTSYIYCCGHKDKIIKHHILRVFIATFFWWFWTSAFNVIETNYGKCNIKGEPFNNKQSCLKAGNFWNGFDISGHSFILVYGSLFLIEETRSMINWDTIKEFIRLEDYYRSTKDTSPSTNPLRYLTEPELTLVRDGYEKYTPYIRSLFIVMTFFQLLWDVMLVCTMLYYHVMVEKFLGGAIAILTWFFTYRYWFTFYTILPKLPGDGVFKYMKGKPAQVPPVARRRTGSIVNGSQPTFMGRPLYPTRTEVNEDDNIR